MASSTGASPSSVELVYFAGRGRAEFIRLLLADAGVEWTEAILKTRQQFLDLVASGRLPFHKVPLLHIDGRDLVESKSILRYLARQYGTRCVCCV